MKKTGVLVSAVIFAILPLLLSPGPLSARPEFARMTGQACGSCHISAFGGGPLGPEGMAFKESLKRDDGSVDDSLRLSTGQKLLRIGLWFIHIPFGAGWIALFFLTFLPALRSGTPGIPSKARIRQIYFFMAVTALSGSAMVFLKLRLVPGLFGTRFGILLLVKIAAAGILLIATVALIRQTTILPVRRHRKLSAQFKKERELDLSREDLRLFDGSEKRDAFVAVNGDLYDVTGRDLWRKGLHPGGHRAGTDLTKAFRQAPHGREVLTRLMSVGKLEGKSAGKRSEARWAIAAGTVAAAAILLVVVLWRW
jgi:predicted heme/steroid binding protein